MSSTAHVAILHTDTSIASHSALSAPCRTAKALALARNSPCIIAGMLPALRGGVTAAFTNNQYSRAHEETLFSKPFVKYRARVMDKHLTSLIQTAFRLHQLSQILGLYPLTSTTLLVQLLSKVQVRMALPHCQRESLGTWLLLLSICRIMGSSRCIG